MVACSVKSCKSNIKRKHIVSEDVHFHRFPKNQELEQIWVNACDNPNIKVKYGKEF